MANQQQSEFQRAMNDVRSGSEDAVWHLIAVYGPHIRRVVRRKLDRHMRSKFDSIDFVQMVWASFFREPDEIAGFENPHELVAHLATLARNKVIDEYRRRMWTQKYNVMRECSLDESAGGTGAVAAADPTPSQIAIARERWDQILKDQPQRNRQVVQMRIQGATFEEIGRSLGIHERTARRIIDQLSGSG